MNTQVYNATHKSVNRKEKRGTLSAVCCNIFVPPNRTCALSRLIDSRSSFPLLLTET